MGFFSGIAKAVSTVWNGIVGALAPKPAPPPSSAPAPAPKPAAAPIASASPPAGAGSHVVQSAQTSFSSAPPGQCVQGCPAAAPDYLKPAKGQLTFNSEGNDDPSSPYYTRRPHLPPSPSGVTVGRGLDLSTTMLSNAELKKALKDGGLPDDEVNLLLGAHKLNRDESEAYFAEHEEALKKIELTQKQQHDLFNTTYAKYEADTKRLYDNKTSGRLTEKYGSAKKWDELDPKIQDVLVDMRYRGDFGYDNLVGSGMGQGVVDNKPSDMLSGLENSDYWSTNTNLDENRRNLRADYVRGL